MKDTSDQTKGAALLLALGFAWGSFWPLMKLVLLEMPLLTYRGLCAVAGGLLVMALALIVRQGLRVAREEWGPLVLLSLFMTTGWLYFTGLGVSLIGPGRAVLVAYTMPLWSYILGVVFLGERPSLRRWIGLAIALSGIGLMLSQDYERLVAAPAGVLAMLGAAVSWALGSVVLKKRVWSTPNFTLIGWQTLLGGLPICLAIPFFETEELRPLTPLGWFSFVYTIAASTVFGVWAWFRCVQLLSVSVASLGVLLVPVIGLSLSALIVDEPLGWPEWTALALIVAGLAAVMPLPRLSLQALRRSRRSGERA